MLGSFVYTTREALSTAVRNSKTGRPFSPPIVAGVGHLSGLKLPTQNAFWLAGQNDAATWYVNVGEITVPEVDCWFVLTPYRIDGGEPDLDAANRLARLVAVLSAYCGPNIFRDVISEGEVNAADGKFQVSGNFTRTPSDTEGPFLHVDLMRDMWETAKGIALQPENRRRRLERAVEYLGRGIRDNDDFFSYWMALELVADGQAGTIRSRLQEIYGLKSHKPVEEETGFPVLRAWRHAFVHGGTRPHVSADVARYIHFMFLELLRHEIGLPARGLVAMVQNQPGYDLSPLGLSDNRTERQKAAMAATVGAHGVAGAQPAKPTL